MQHTTHATIMLALTRIISTKSHRTVLRAAVVPMTTMKRPFCIDTAVDVMVPIWEVTVPLCTVIGSVCAAHASQLTETKPFDKVAVGALGASIGAAAGAICGICAPLALPIAIPVVAWHYLSAPK